jgi:acetylornithine deacetylase/succinyl-diaminopimelate desuccinylase-like protein
MPDPESAVVKLAGAIARLGKRRLPLHPTPVVKAFIHGLAARLPAAQGAVMKRLTTPQAAALVLDHLVRDPAQRRSFGAMLANTASPNILSGGRKINVIPGRASVDIDGRTLPGHDGAFLAELGLVLGEEAKVEVLFTAPPVVTPHDTPLFAHLARTITRRDPVGHPLPYMIPGFTDAKAYARLGTHCYGFSPVRFDPTHDVSFQRMYHGHDERVPVDGLRWGLEVLHEAVTTFSRQKEGL